MKQPGRTLSEILIDHIRSRNLLLILDNCEHLVEACAGLAGKMLSASPDLKILATSREALNIPGEVVYRLKPLRVPEPSGDPSSRLQNESVRLFIERAQNVLPVFQLSESNIEPVSQICRRLDGIPLAIELAAARINILSVEQIASRLDDRFNLLTSGKRTGLPHQQTLRAEIDWSYQLLSESEQAFFRRCSVFSGSWILDAAEAICSAEAGCINLLGSLVDKSLVVVDQHGDEPRYHSMKG